MLCTIRELQRVHLLCIGCKEDMMSFISQRSSKMGASQFFSVAMTSKAFAWPSVLLHSFSLNRKASTAARMNAIAWRQRSPQDSVI